MAFLLIDKIKIVRPCLPLLFSLIILVSGLIYSFYSIDFVNRYLNFVFKCMGYE